jgi:hypothetical protein
MARSHYKALLEKVLLGFISEDDPVLQTGFPPALFPQAFDPLLLVGLSDILEVLTRATVDSAGLGDAVEKLRQL